MRNRPSAPPLSEYYYHEDHGSTASTSAGSDSYGDCSPYATITIPPPPKLPLPELPPPPYPPRDPILAQGGGVFGGTYLIGERAANFDVPTSKIKKRQFKPRRSYNPLTLTRRGCTDVICCLLLVLFLVAWGMLAACAFMWGKPERLLHPTDSRGRTCGTSRKGAYDLTSKPYLLFFDLTKCVSYTTVLTGCPTRQVCVEKCPTSYFSYLQLQSTSVTNFQQAMSNSIYCDDSVDKTQITTFAELKQFVDAGLCTAYTVKSAAVLGRCMPEVFIDAESVLANATSANSTLDKIIATVGNAGGQVPSDAQLRNSTDVLDGVVNSRAVLQKIGADISVSWWQILCFFGIAAVVSFLWTVLMRLLGGFMIWLSIFVLLALLGAGSVYSWMRYQSLRAAGAVNDYSFQPVFSVYFEMPTTWIVIAIALSIFLLVIFVIFIIVRSRIKLAVAVIQETSRALGSMLSTLFFPIIPFILHLLVFALWGSIAIWLSTSGDENCRLATTGSTQQQIENGTPCDCELLGTAAGINCHYVNVTRDSSTITYMQLYNLFGCFWLSCFVGALSDITLAGAFASYYWAYRKPRDVPAFPVLRSMGRALFYHLGSLAFGSLIIAIVKFIRAILEFLYQKLHASENKVAKALFCLLQCFFCCLESILRCLTKNAYIMIAMYGHGFFRSAKDSFSLLARNIIRTVVLGRVVAFLLFVGKATITVGMGVVAFYYFSGRWIIDGLPQITLYYYFVPVIIVVVGTYCICDLFFQVFEMGVDTIYLCFLEDSESNDGSTAKPFYMSDQLKKIYGKENKF